MTDRQISMTQNPLNSLISGAGISLITGILGYLISNRFGFEGDQKTIIVSLCVLVGSLTIIYFYRKVTNISEELFEKFMSEHTGIIKTFKNLEECGQEIMEDFKNAKNIRLLLQIGRREFGNQEPSFFWTLSKDKKEHDTKIKVLKASTNSPFLSELRAQRRNYGVTQWRSDMRRLDEALNLLKSEYNCRIEVRDHSEPFLWRIFLFDDIAYVSAYLYKRNNDRQAVVYKLQKNDKSLYTVFDKYFDYLWLKYDTSIDDPINKFADWT